MIKRTISRKIIVILGLCMMPIYFIGVCLYFWGRNTLHQQTEEDQIRQADYYINDLQNNVERTQTLQFIFFNDIFLNRITDSANILSNYDRDTSLLNVERNLNTLLNSNRYLDGATIYIPRINKKITAVTINSMSQTDIDHVEQLKNNQSSSPLIIDDKGKINIYASAYKGYDKTDKDMPKFLMEVSISKENLNQALIQLNQGNRGYILYRNNTEFICKNGMTDVIKDILEYMNGTQTGNNTMFKLKSAGEEWQVYNIYSEKLDLNYITFYSKTDLYHGFDKYIGAFIIFTLLVVVVIFVFYYYIKNQIQKPVNQLLDSFEKIEAGNINLQIEYKGHDEFRQIFTGFNHMTHKLSELIDRVYVQELLMQKANLKQLQSQINPHFLFNCFFILKRRIKYGELESAIELADYMGVYFRYITRTASETVLMEKEVEHARIYASIQASRFSRRIKVEFEDLPKQYNSMTVERLILQPVIENAFEYGLESKTEGGLLQITFREEENFLIICIEDNGDTLTDEVLEAQVRRLENSDLQINGEDEITGIVNINKRIQYTMGKECGIKLSRSSLGGLKVTIYLKIQR